MTSKNMTHDEALDLAYQISDMISVSRFAIENETEEIPADQRGAGRALQMASNMTGELIELIENLEAASRKTAEEPAS